MSRVLVPALLGLLWLALWGEVSVANLVSGAVVIPLVMAAVPRHERRHRVHAVAVLRLGLDFARRLVISSLTVARAVLAPTPERTRSAVVRFEMRSSSALVATVLADAISLTPGTLTIEVHAEPPALDVHVMGHVDDESVRADLRSLETLVLAALEPLEPDGNGERPATTEEER